MTERTIHEGRNVKRIREILGMKQDTLALELGLSQQAISALEQKEALDKDMLEKIAGVLKVNSDAIKSFNEETAVNFFNTFNDTSVNHGAFAAYNFNCTFNPLDKVIELYEALLKSEREKNILMERLLEKKN
jgi:transcriptional regulator with XRE-family HTH domain